ncbi:MAG TPA: ABC transporter substrate-binding protein [Dehalococcoidia bacterium]|nr:ABC transporter substrate-binding protein [Dehalococcoidia bacterium]
MSPRSLSRISLLFLVLALAAVLAFAACKDDEKKTGTTPSASPTPAAIDISGVPELADGKLLIGSDIAYAPLEFYQTGTETPDGLDVDLAKAIAEALGVEVEFVNSGFDGIIQALNTEEFDAVMSAMTIDEERSQLVDFVPYLNVGVGIVVPAGNPNNIAGLDDLCGLTVAVQLGTVQEKQLKTLNDETCGDNDVKIVTFDTNPLAVEDVVTGGADANFSDFPVAFLDAQQSDGALEVVEPAPNPQPYGIAVRKGSTELKGVLTEALQAVKSSGKYDEVLAKWDLESTALP